MATITEGQIISEMGQPSQPGKPRGKMTAYAFFVHTCRQELKNSRPNQNVVFGEFSKKCASKWKELEPHNKKPFEDMAARDKVRYEQELELQNRRNVANQNTTQQHHVIQTTGPNGETVQQIMVQQTPSNIQSGSNVQHVQVQQQPQQTTGNWKGKGRKKESTTKRSKCSKEATFSFFIILW